MANDPNKSPDKDEAFDDGLEEIDIDDLLLDDDTPLKAEAAAKAGDQTKPEIIDDGEIDLLDVEEPLEAGSPSEPAPGFPTDPAPGYPTDPTPGEDLLAEDVVTPAGEVPVEDLLEVEEPLEAGYPTDPAPGYPTDPAPGAAPVEDLLELEEEPPSDPVRQTVLDSPTNGNPPGLDEEIALAPAKDDDADFDLLAEDEAPTDFLDDVPAEGPAGPQPVADAAPSEDRVTLPEPLDEVPGASSDEETAPLPAAAEADGEPTRAGRPLAGKKKLGKLKAGKPLKAGKKGKKEKESEEAPAVLEPAKEKAKEKKKPKEKKTKPSKEQAPVERRVTVGARGSITFVCSECYEEFLIPSSYSQEMVSCPECLHVGKRPDEEFLRTVHLHKAGEKRSFHSAVAVGAILFAVVTALVWFNTPYGAGGMGGTLAMPLLGAAGLLTVILIWLVVRFEGNRWEVYF